MNYHCKAGILSYDVSLDDEALLVRGPLKQTRVQRSSIVKLGIASAALDRRLLFGPLALVGGRSRQQVRVDDEHAVQLPAGLAGLVVL
jgi:hypothetical protein